MTVPRRHHYLPESYLENFCVPEIREKDSASKLYVYEKTAGCPTLSAQRTLLSHLGSRAGVRAPEQRLWAGVELFQQAQQAEALRDAEQLAALQADAEKASVDLADLDRVVAVKDVPS